MAVDSKKPLVLLPVLLLLLLLVQAQGARRPSSSWSPAKVPNSSNPSSSTSKCPASSVTVSQTNTGANNKAGYGHDDPVFEVAVRNGCARCAVRAVYLRSEGFASSAPVDPRLFRRQGRDYLVAGGRRIEPGAEVRFRYAWDRAFRMAPAALQDDCS